MATTTTDAPLRHRGSPPRLETRTADESAVYARGSFGFTKSDDGLAARVAAALESYFAAGFWQMFRKRLPWLVLLLGAQMLTTIALTGFSTLPLFAVMVWLFF